MKDQKTLAAEMKPLMAAATAAGQDFREKMTALTEFGRSNMTNWGPADLQKFFAEEMSDEHKEFTEMMTGHLEDLLGGPVEPPKPEGKIITLGGGEA